MVIALSIFKIKGINKKVFLNPTKNKITLNDFEKRIDDYTDVNGNPAPSTILRRKYVNQKKTIADYAVEHWTDTTKDIIRVFVDDLQDSLIYNKYNIVPKTTYNISHGYQMKIDFKASIYFKDKYLFVFSNKRYSKQFIKRLESVGALKYERLRLKIKDITKNSNIQNGLNPCKYTNS